MSHGQKVSVRVKISEGSKRVRKEVAPKRESDGAAQGETPRDGFHRGVLAGLDESERERKALGHLVDQIVNDPLALNPEMWMVFEGAREISDTRSVLSLLPRDELESLAGCIGLESWTLSDKKLIKRLAKRYATDEKLFRKALIAAEETQFGLFMEAAKRGMARVSLKDDPSALLADPLIPYACHSVEGDELVVRVSEDARRMLVGMDSEELANERAELNELYRFARECLKLYGIIPLEEARAQYREACGRSCTPKRFEELLRSCEKLPNSPLGVWKHQGTRYLAPAVRRPQVTKVMEADSPMSERRPLSDEHMRGAKAAVEQIYLMTKEKDEAYREELLAMHEGLSPRPFPSDMTDKGYLLWCAGIPAARNLRDYFDQNVPDGEDDYSFSDGLVTSLIEEAARAEGDPRACLLVLDDAGYFELPKRELMELARLVWDLCVQLPQRQYYGWSEEEIEA